MKSFKIKIETSARTSEHRWCPDPNRRNRVMKNKKAYTRKGQPTKVDPSSIRARFIPI